MKLKLKHLCRFCPALLTPIVFTFVSSLLPRNDGLRRPKLKPRPRSEVFFAPISRQMVALGPTHLTIEERTPWNTGLYGPS